MPGDRGVDKGGDALDGSISRIMAFDPNGRGYTQEEGNGRSGTGFGPQSVIGTVRRLDDSSEEVGPRQKVQAYKHLRG
jgi:hypothetical protein